MTDVVDPYLLLIGYFSYPDTSSFKNVSLRCDFELLVVQQFSLQ